MRTARGKSTKPVGQVRSTRSPNYPYLSLPGAIERAEAVYAKVGRHTTGKEVLSDAWGLAATSGTFRLVLAALRAYGLLDNVSGREEPLVKLSERALDILADYAPGDPRQRGAIRDAALAPRLHAELWGQYGAELPDNSEIRRFLVRAKNFNDGTADKFIGQYKATLEFAGLLGTLRSDPEGGREPVGAVAGSGGGGVVHSTSGQIDGSPEPRRSMRVGEDGSCANVAGSSAAVAAQEFVRVPDPSGGIAALDSHGIRQEVFPLLEGEVVLRIPDRMSPSSYEDVAEWLLLVLRKTWRSVEGACGAGRPPRPLRLVTARVPER
jgi:hypothetical protein